MPERIVKALLLTKIRAERSISARTSLPEDVIESYREAMERKDSFPAIVAFHDGENYWLADGFVRVEAARRAGHKYVEVDVREGVYRDAKFYAAGANRAHGARRAPCDVRLACLNVLSDKEGSTWPLSRVAKHVGCSIPLVRALKELLAQQSHTPTQWLALQGVLSDSGSRDRRVMPAQVVEPAVAAGKPAPHPPAPYQSISDPEDGPVEPTTVIAPDIGDELQEIDREDRQMLEERLRRAMRKARRFALLAGFRSLVHAATELEPILEVEVATRQRFAKVTQEPAGG